MSVIKCNNIKPEYNRLIFRVKMTMGDHMFARPSRGIYTRSIPEGYYMNRKAPKKTNPVVSLFKRMYAEIKSFIESYKGRNIQSFEETKNIKGTTIEI